MMEMAGMLCGKEYGPPKSTANSIVSGCHLYSSPTIKLSFREEVAPLR
jgi:hypothetical protein